jgi:putative SOS response-associated peptidase YedK
MCFGRRISRGDREAQDTREKVRPPQLAASFILREQVAHRLALPKPCPDEWLKIWPVDKKVGNVRNKGAELVLPL